MQNAVAVSGARENHSQMKMEIFDSSDRSALERRINEWLSAEGVSEIHHVTHANEGTTVYITVWYSPARKRAVRRR